MDQCRELWLPILIDLCAAKNVILRNEGVARSLEKLQPEKILYRGTAPSGPVQVRENGLDYTVELWDGQKTGWFFDQRDNRALVAGFARGARVLDLYTYLGGFGLLAAHAGAQQVTLVDRSAPALALAKETAAAQKMDNNCAFVTAEIFDYLPQLSAAGEKFDIVIADPPAFAKAAKDLPVAKKAYQKLAQLCAGLMAPGGFLFIASCSYHMPLDEFSNAIAGGLHRAGRAGRILRSVAAGMDHPTHPHLPHSAYLKGLWLQLD
jgi:23S rRNA (cytosine1962-C5)-methyltransferase